MRCTSCLRNVAAGVEAQKMIVEYRQHDGSTKMFGYMMSDGPLTEATGQMLRGWHSKCFWTAKKREARGGSVTGRVLPGGPTGYEIDQLVLSKDDLDVLGLTEAEALERGTVQVSARLVRLREVAEQIGKGVGDPQVQEAFIAHEHGGPYPHYHEHRLEIYQLVAHLEYAHGVKDVKILRTNSGLQDQHMELHAKAAEARILNDRLVDDEPARPETDWREQRSYVLE